MPTSSALIVGLLLGCAGFFATADTLSDAQRLMRQGQKSQALEKVDAYLASKPADAQGRFLKGLLLTEMGKPPEAIAVFSKLTEDYPELPEPYNNLAVLYAQQKQYDKARTALEMAIRIHPGYTTAYDNLGDVYARLAAQAYDKALQFDPSRRVTQSKLARLRELNKPSTSSPGVAMRPAGETSSRMSGTELAAMPVASAPAASTAAAVVSAGQGIAPLAAATAADQSAQQAAAARVEVPRMAAAAAGDEEAVTKALQAWANAWSRKDAKAYLAYYAADFRTPRGIPRKAWEIERTRPMNKPGRLQVEIEDIKVSFADDKATVRLRQHYSSPYLKSSVTKTIILVKSRGRWLIQQERIG
ncbi:MAG TPA: tetratricopeptide repeat protein [Candidatus Accumulibacter phosphatis]|nr:tetratricopeptide repeat protein [Candidatus Accumulibacter phosphatis]